MQPSLREVGYFRNYIAGICKGLPRAPTTAWFWRLIRSTAPDSRIEASPLRRRRAGSASSNTLIIFIQRRLILFTYVEQLLETASSRRIAIIVAGSIVYAALTPILGFYLVSGIFLFSMTLCLQDEGVSMKRTAVNGLVLSFVLCVSIYVFFTILLNVPTPEVIDIFES